MAKLFAKHFKLEEHVTYLKRTKIGAAVGTPGRLGKTAERDRYANVHCYPRARVNLSIDALSVSALSHIILDTSHKDAKTRTMLDIPETRDEVFKTVLKNEAVLQGIKEGKIQVVLF